jgi:hypothetical protein
MLMPDQQAMANKAPISSFPLSVHLVHVPTHQLTVSLSLFILPIPFILTDITGWEDISLVLNEADPSFAHAGAWDFGATGGEMSSDDNGVT